MDGTLITPSFTSLYGQTEINPLHPAHLAGCDIGNTHTSVICRLHRAKVEEAIRLIRPLWTPSTAPYTDPRTGSHSPTLRLKTFTT